MMTADLHRGAELPEGQRQELEALLAGFEGSWDDRRLAVLAGQIPPDSPLRRPALREMVKIDLRRQWQGGRQPVLEAYLHFYPELGSRDTVPADLVYAEFTARRRRGARAELADFARRFPRQAGELRALVERDEAHDSTWRTRPEEPPITPAAGGTGGLTPPAQAGQTLPEQFGRYRLLRQLGKGGMGAVYLAHDTQLDRRVALKVPHFGGEGGLVLERFQREARAAAAIEHPNICPIFDIGQVNGVHYLTMAYLDGQPLVQVIQSGGPLPPPRATALVRDLARALHEAHRHGVIHRDLKPSNVMIQPSGVPVIMDFGLARRLDHGDEKVTRTGCLLGTPAYMPPEQVSGDVDAMGPGCDIYSLGVILYELLTGRRPFQGPVASILGQILSQPPAPPSTIRPGLDPRLERACLRALAKKPEDRFRSMAEMAEVLDACLGGDAGTSPAEPLPVATPASATAPYLSLPGEKRPGLTPTPVATPFAGETTRRPPRRRLLLGWVISAAAAGLVLLGGGIFLLLSGLGSSKIPSAGAEEARSARDEAANSRQEARQARAPDEASSFWDAAETKYTEAEKQFRAGDFTGAKKNWQAAALAYGTAQGAVAGLPRVRKARAAYEEEVKKQDREQLERDAGPVWKKVVRARKTAERAAGRGRFSEAVEQYREAQKLVAEAGRVAEIPRLQVETFGAGYEFGSWVMVNVVGPSGVKDPKMFQDYLEEARPRLRRKLEGVQLPADLVKQILEEEKWTAEKVKLFRKRLGALLSRSRGRRLGAAFQVGDRLAWVLGALLVEGKHPGKIKKESFTNMVAEAREAAYEAGHPQEMVDALGKIASWWEAGELAKAGDFTTKFLNRLTRETTAVKFFRQPPAVGARAPKK
jgi:hypothetical protein